LNETDELLDQIQEFKGSSFASRLARIKRADIDDPHSLADLERVEADELRVTECKKGDEVVTPNDPGHVEEIDDYNMTCTVVLDTTNEWRNYPISRLTKAASIKTAQDESDELDEMDVEDTPEDTTGAEPMPSETDDALIDQTMTNLEQHAEEHRLMIDLGIDDPLFDDEEYSQGEMAEMPGEDMEGAL